ncbi:pLS20_p028 family conjugation system transmembrane protein [Enterococcus alishanensis]
MLILDMNNPDILHLLNNYRDYTWITNPIIGFFFTLLGLVVKGLYSVSSALEEIFNKIFLVFGFMGDSGLFSGLHKVFLVIGGVCLLGSILYFGYMAVLGYKVDIKNVIRNVVLTVVIFGLIPALTSSVGTIVGDANRQIQAAPSSNSEAIASAQDKMSLQPLKANIHDFLWLQSKGFPDWDDSPEHITLTDKKVSQLNFGELIPNDNKWYDNFLNFSVGSEEKDKLFQYEGSEDVTGDNEEFTEYHKIPKAYLLKGLENGWMRYKVFYIPLLLQQILLICLFAFTFLKLVKLATEMVIIQQFVPVIAFSDIHDGSKIKATFQTIINSFIVMILLCANLRIFLIISQAVNVYLSSTGGSQNLKNLTYTFFQIGIFLAVVSGVGVVERIFGISTNMKSEALGAGIGVAAGVNLVRSLAGNVGELGQKLLGGKSQEDGSSNNTNNNNSDNPNLNENDNDNTNNKNEENNQTDNNHNEDHNNVEDEGDKADNNLDNPNLNTEGDGDNLDNPNLNADDELSKDINNLDNPNLTSDEDQGEGVDNLDNPNLSPEDENDNESDNKNLDDSNKDDNIENPNLGEEENMEPDGIYRKNLHNSNNDNLSGEENQSENLDQENTEGDTPTQKKTTRSRINHSSHRSSKGMKNIMGDAMIRNQALDDEGQTKGKPLNEEPKEY